MSKLPGQVTRPAEAAHLAGEFALSVKGVQVSDHDVSRLLQRHGAGLLGQGPHLRGGVEGNSPGAAASRAAAFWGRG